MATAAVVLDTVASFDASDEAKSMLENGSKVLGLVMLDAFLGAL